MEIIAHRGIHGDRVLENSDRAVTQALNAGCQAIEVDLQLTRDGEVIVFHDFCLQRIFGVNKALRDVAFDELQQLTCHDYPEGKIVSLAQLLEMIPRHIWLNLELKSASLFDRGKLVEKVIKQLADHCHLNILFSSFNPWLLYKCRRAKPQIQRAWLINRKIWSLNLIIRLSRVRPHFIHCSLKLFKSTYYTELISIGLPIRVFTVNNLSDYHECQRNNILGVFSDNPAIFSEIGSHDS